MRSMAKNKKKCDLVAPRPFQICMSSVTTCKQFYPFVLIFYLKSKLTTLKIDLNF